MRAKSRLLWMASAASLMLSGIGRAQERPIVIRAATLIDGNNERENTCSRNRDYCGLLWPPA